MTCSRAKSWFAWRVLLIAAAGEKLNEEERVTFKKLTGRDHEPLQMVQELVAVFGRRGGKSLALATFATWISTCVDWKPVLGLAKGTALLVSRDQKIASIILDYIERILSGSPLLRKLIRNRVQNIIELKNDIVIEVSACNSFTLRGPTLITACADEVAFWYTDENNANPDSEVFAAIKPALLSTGGPLLLASSAYARYGELYDTWKRDYGPAGDPRILVGHGSSRDVNPSLSQAEIDRYIASDPVRNRAEYLSEFRDDTSGFIGRDIVEQNLGDWLELPPVNGITYICFLDAASGTASGKGDSYAAAVGSSAG